MLLPLQIATDEGLIEADGVLFTETVLAAVALQLFASVTVTVYVVLPEGETLTCALVPKPLLQLYAVPPDAVKFTLPPAQMETEEGEMPALGRLFTLTVAVAVAVQLLASVTVRV